MYFLEQNIAVWNAFGIHAKAKLFTQNLAQMFINICTKGIFRDCTVKSALKTLKKYEPFDFTTTMFFTFGIQGFQYKILVFKML